MKITKNIYLVGSGQMGLSHQFDCHVYLIDGKKELALIDPGAGVDTEPILKNIEDDGFDPLSIKKIFVTHSHADHVGGCKSLKDELGCDVYALEGADYLIENGTDEELGLEFAKRSAVYSPEYEYPHTKVDVSLKGGEVTKVGNLSLEAIHTPGHSKYSTCYLIEKGNYRALFSGDVVFFEGKIGLLNCPGSCLADYRDNIDKLADLSIDGLFPGHYLFVLEGGQQHIDEAINSLKRLTVPPTFFSE